MLSKAFRNRFIQIEVPDINIDDMAAIIKRRCLYVPPSHIPYMLSTFKEVNLYRSSEHLLMQRSGMITLRDLIKWGARMQHTTPENPKEALAMEGYCLLVEKLRDQNSIHQITAILEKIFSMKIDCSQYYESFV
jgi:midasin